MENNVAIVTDSTIALPESLIQEYGLHIVPLSILWDGKTYIDGIDITPKEFYKRLSHSENTPMTSQPSVAAFNEVFVPLIDQGYDILTLPLSSKISGTYLSAASAAKQFPKERIVVFDSLMASLPLGMVAITTAKAAKKGATLLECLNIAQDAASRMHVFFAVETLEYLHKGGRINSATKFLGTALDLKPILELKDGEVLPRERVRTSKKAHSRLIDLAEEVVGPKGRISYLGLVAANSDQGLMDLHDEAHQRFRIDEEIFAELSPVIGTHAGPGAVGFVFMV